MKINKVSRRYAKALYGLAKSKGHHEKIYAELKELSKSFFEDADIKNFIISPLNSSDKKESLIEASLKNKNVSEEIIGTLRLLARNKRLSLLEEVSRAYLEESDKDHGILRGCIRSSGAVSEAKIKDLESKASSITNKKVNLVFQQEAHAIGGLTVQVGGLTFEDTLEFHLKKLNDELKRRTK